jgi:hypothetical protein
MGFDRAVPWVDIAMGCSPSLRRILHEIELSLQVVLTIAQTGPSGASPSAAWLTQCRGRSDISAFRSRCVNTSQNLFYRYYP